MNSIKQFLAFFGILSIAVLTGCKDNDNPDKKREITLEEQINIDIYEIMKGPYLWNDKVQDVQNPEEYASLTNLINDLRYPVYDKWSYAMDYYEYLALYERGESGIGHGFYPTADFENEAIRVAFTYPTAEPYQEGVRRGWIINKVNGTEVSFVPSGDGTVGTNLFTLLGSDVEGVANDFEFIDTKGITHNITLTKTTVVTSPILHSEIINRNNKKIGYLVFNDFIEPAFNQLDTAFTRYTNEGIDELIVDLRYNGGGMLTVGTYFSSLLAGNTSSSDVLLTLDYNEEYQSWNESYTFTDTMTNRVNLDRLIFITSDNTASASELTINGVKPYVDEVVLVGSATHGKPVGMDGFPLPLPQTQAEESNDPNYIFYPVTFRFVNALGDGDFFNGIQVNVQANDDVTKSFGDQEEESLKAALDYIDGKALKSAFTLSKQGKPLFEIKHLLINDKKNK